MIVKTKFKGLFLFKNKNFKDKRGYFKEIIRENKLKKKFHFLVMSYSKKNVIRGLHIQKTKPQGKFISVIKGKIFDIALDLRRKSKTFGKYYSLILDEKKTSSIYIPPGFAHGFQALSDKNYIVYSCTEYRNEKSEISINPFDHDLNIKWPNKKKIVSKKDQNSISFRVFLKTYPQAIN